MKLRVLAIVTALALPTAAIADDKTPTTDKTTGKAAKFGDGDVKIIAHLHHVNQMEIDLGKVARKNGTASLTSYSETLETDHKSADKDLTSFAKKHGLTTIPADKPQTDAEKQEQNDAAAKVARVKTLKGAEFDKEFLTIMVSDHEKELTRIEPSISTASDPDLQAILQSFKPVLQRHADQARDLLKNAQASGSQPITKGQPSP